MTGTLAQTVASQPLWYHVLDLPGGDYATACRAAAAAASDACRDASAAGARGALVSVSFLFLWSGAHFLLAARHMRAELPPHSQA